MVSARALLLGALLACLACQPAPRELPEALVLRGFKVVDPESRSVSVHDVVIERGVVVARPSQPGARVIDGGGRYLLPALWDLKASLWGNNSLYDYEVLQQESSFTNCKKLQLFYGVGHVGVFAMQRDWVGRELKRAEALELDAAEALYADTALCGAASFACTAPKDARALREALDARKRAGAPLVYISFLPPKSEPLGGLAPELQVEALSGARKRGLPSVVLVDSWQSALRAAELGADVVHGFPEGIVPDEVAGAFAARGVAFAPALALHLEADRLLSDSAARSEPFLTQSVMPEVLASFASEQGIFHEWRADLRRGRAFKESMLRSVRALAQRGVRLIATSDAGWSAGTFQGYGSHAAQAWLERAGVEPWARLSAATLWPAQALGRRVGFAPGDAADFLAVEQDPRASAENLRRITLLVRQGRVVERERLLPDVTRTNYHR